LAIFSDIHGNMEAFKEVVRDIQEQRVQECFFLGDAISYGPESDRVVRLLQKLGISCVLGNHELALLHSHARYYFNTTARLHFVQVERLISEKSRRFISTWPESRREQGMLLVHGCPPDSITRYLFDLAEHDFLPVFQKMDDSVAFVGHTHDLELIQHVDSDVRRRGLAEGVYFLEEDKAVVNVGGVGQPRDGDNRAKYVIWEPEARRLEVRFVEYSIKKTAEGILKRGFPEFFARRLW